MGNIFTSVMKAVGLICVFLMLCILAATIADVIEESLETLYWCILLLTVYATTHNLD